MPRSVRLDAPGTLHHVIIRGIEKRRIVDDTQDRQVFVGQLGRVDAKARLVSLVLKIIRTRHYR